MIYRLPALSDQELLQAYVQEHYDHKETGISASLGLTSSVYADWVEKIRQNASLGDEQWGKSLLYLCFEQEELVGLLSIRPELPDHLSNSLGDIGYGVRPSERNKGYATTMLRHGLSVCREQGKRQVILGCYQDNVASVKVIEKNGGMLFAQNDNYAEGKISQYFVIRL